MNFNQGGGGSDNLLNAIAAELDNEILRQKPQDDGLSCRVGKASTFPQEIGKVNNDEISLKPHNDKNLVPYRPIVLTTNSTPSPNPSPNPSPWERGKIAFTLAEVLITLGIIGVVAAMTLPALVQNYKRNVLSTRIAKFASIYQQAVRMAEVEHGEFQYWDSLSEPDDKEITNTGESYLKHYNKYMAKYIKTTSYKVLPDGVAFSLADGSGFIYYYDLKFCVDYRKCLNLIDKSVAEGGFAAKNGLGVDGKNIFLFKRSGKTYDWRWNGTKDDLRTNSSLGCREKNNYPLFCAKLIESNGWQVPKDYPIKL